MGDQVGVDRSELPPSNSDKGQALVEFTYSNAAEVTGTSNNTEAAKATRVKERENSVPIEGDAQ